MEFQHINAKIFVDGELTVPLDQFIGVFHRWVAAQDMDEMLIDVADYRHVPAGPGVVLVALEADYSIDHTGGRYGLRYNRKAPLDGSNDDRFLASLRAAAQACAMLESEFDGLRFSRTEFELFINDRALAPHTDETLGQFKPALTAFLENVLGQRDSSVAYTQDPRALVGAQVRLAAAVEWANVPTA